jgi:prephenate dehydrogenase
MTLKARTVHVVGLGLIGGSIARALSRAGWSVSGEDVDKEAELACLALGYITSKDRATEAELVIVATPAGNTVEVVAEVLASVGPNTVVTDVAGVKNAIVHGMPDERFVGGHPMAGSEVRRLAGSSPDLFMGATWVLTPTPATTPDRYRVVHDAVRDMGANPVAVLPDDHDRLMAVASHVPHLLAGALMTEAADIAQDDSVLLRLTAGGFRDMTRIAAGEPSIWPDVLLENRDAVLATLSSIRTRLSMLEDLLSSGERTSLLTFLDAAAEARRHLPGRAVHASQLSYLRVNIPDEPGVLATITTLAANHSVNLYDIEIAHGVEGVGGTLILAVDQNDSDAYASALRSLKFQVSIS